jgi:RimJ/RimL family protein N-acetyltransferase
MADRPIRGPRGEHVYLRPLEPDDAEIVHGWYADERFRVRMGESPMSLARRRQRYADVAAHPEDDVVRFVICRIEDDAPVGRADIFMIDRVNGSCGFGIGIGGASSRGKGLGTDAVGALIDFAFGELRMERVWLDTEDSNTRAQASYRKAGFTEEGRLRHAWFVDGAYVDGVRMSILRDEWLALSRPRSWDRTTGASGGE